MPQLNLNFIDIPIPETCLWEQFDDEQKRIVIETDLEKRLPSIPGDRVQLQQVIFNLLDNAAKYAPAETTISIRSFRDRDSVSLEQPPGF